MYSIDDVVLSLRRYLQKGLGEDWKIRTEAVEVRDKERPAAVIDFAPMSTPVKRVSLTQGPVTQTARLTATFYPTMTGSQADSSRRARQVMQLLEDTISLGLDLGTFDPPHARAGRPIAAPDRIPLYDYAGVLNEADAPTYPHDWLWVTDSSANAIQDPDDVRRWTVPLELSVSWERPGRIPAEDVDAPVAGSMPGTFVPPASP